MAGTKSSGNRTRRRGRKLRRLIRLDDAAALALRTIVASQDRPGDEDRIVSDMVIDNHRKGHTNDNDNSDA